MTKTYKIADLIIRITGDLDDSSPIRMHAYETDELNDATIQPDILVHFEANCPSIDLPQGQVIAKEWPQSWMQLHGGGFALFDTIPDIPNQILLLATMDEDFSRINIKLCDQDLLLSAIDHRHYLFLGNLFRMAILYHNGMVLHSSSILYRGDALLFSAPSGTGKSTHTGLWRTAFPNDTAMLNDDTPAIRFTDRVVSPIAYGTPWSGTSGINNNLSGPLKAIIFLKQASQNAIYPITGGEAAWRLIHETKKIAFQNVMERSLQIMDRLLSSVPVYLLECTISRDAVETVRREIYETS